MSSALFAFILTPNVKKFNKADLSVCQPAVANLPIMPKTSVYANISGQKVDAVRVLFAICCQDGILTAQSLQLCYLQQVLKLNLYTAAEHVYPLTEFLLENSERILARAMSDIELCADRAKLVCRFLNDFGILIGVLGKQCM